MNNLIGISTGSVYKLTEDRNEAIKILKDFSPDGIEISFRDRNLLYNFKPSRENLDYLKTLKFVTLHAPWHDESNSEEELLKMLNKLNDLNDLLNVKNITFHLIDKKLLRLLKQFSFPYSIENEDFRKDNFKTAEEIVYVLKTDKNLCFTFDIAHALSVSYENFMEFFSLKDRIAEVHIATLIKEINLHTFISTLNQEEKDLILKPLTGLKCPLIIESAVNSRKELGLIKREIKLISQISL